ncbi:MAG TPA: acyloxyacyl hydrolase [Sunxiuqinia sp.]|nr:acyloxyacyl hydrolase [Sunxiuqinia sp.]
MTNPYNVAISAEESVYIDAGVSLKYQLNNRFTFGLGYGFTHFSNGKLKMPNKGLNTQAARASLSYTLNDDPVQFKKQVVPPFHDHFEWLISFYSGMENVLYTGPDTAADPMMRGVNFPIFGMNNTINRQLDYKSKIGVGVTVGYNGSQSTTVVEEDGNLDELDVPFPRHITVSIYPSYELVVNRFSLVIQPGFYLYRKKTTDMTPEFYQRIGVKYHFMKDYFFGVNLRANKFYKSEFIEWTIGHRISL